MALIQIHCDNVWEQVCGWQAVCNRPQKDMHTKQAVIQTSMKHILSSLH